MKNIFLIIALIFYSFSFSQEIRRMYKLSMLEYPQEIELKEYENNTYSGTIVTKLEKGKYKTGWINRKLRHLTKKKNHDIIDINYLDSLTVKQIMTDLKKEGIETIKDCDDCNSFLDGGSIGFEVITKKINRTYYFEEIYPEQNGLPESDPLRRQAQKILSALFKTLNPNEEFYKTLHNLPKGYYNFLRSSGFSIVTVKNGN